MTDRISQKDADALSIAETVAAAPELAIELLHGLDHRTARVRFGSAKVLLILGERYPAVVYPYYSTFVNLLDCSNRIMEWTAIRILGNLACVDRRGRSARLIDRYLDIIKGPDMVAAVNAIAGAAQVARAKPRLARKIVSGILKVEKARYKTVECRNVAIGQAITALRNIGRPATSRPDVVEFVQRQTRNTRPSARKNALAFLDSLGRHCPRLTSEERRLAAKDVKKW